MGPRNRSVVIFLGSGANASQSLAIDRRDLVDLGAAASPLAEENAGVIISDAEFLKDGLHLEIVVAAAVGCGFSAASDRGYNKRPHITFACAGIVYALNLSLHRRRPRSYRGQDENGSSARRNAA